MEYVYMELTASEALFFAASSDADIIEIEGFEEEEGGEESGQRP